LYIVPDLDSQEETLWKQRMAEEQEVGEGGRGEIKRVYELSSLQKMELVFFSSIDLKG
jgi:hypothetical protein